MQKILENKFRGNCANKSAKGRYYATNIFHNFHFVKTNFFKYPYVTLPTKTSVSKILQQIQSCMLKILLVIKLKIILID